MGLLVIPCIQGIIGWTKVVNIYNSITEDLGHQSDQTFRGPGHKIWYIAFAPFENLANLGLKGLTLLLVTSCSRKLRILNSMNF